VLLEFSIVPFPHSPTNHECVDHPALLTYAECPTHSRCLGTSASYNGAISEDGTEAIYGKLFPLNQKKVERGTRRICAVPGGLDFMIYTYPRLKPWAIIFRAQGARVTPVRTPDKVAHHRVR
jgi:hypothetical protein